MKYETNNICIGRKPAEGDDEYKTAIIALFDINNPHKKGAAPTKVLEFRNIEKVQIRGLNDTYYTEGNDIVVNNLTEVSIELDEKKNLVLITGDQGK